MKKFLLTSIAGIILFTTTACELPWDADPGDEPTYGTVTITTPEGTKTLYAEFPITLEEGFDFIWPSWTNPDDWCNHFDLKIDLEGLASGNVYQGFDNDLSLIYVAGCDSEGFLVSYWSDSTVSDKITVTKWEGSGGVFEGSFNGKLYKFRDNSKIIDVSGTFNIAIE